MNVLGNLKNTNNLLAVCCLIIVCFISYAIYTEVVRFSPEIVIRTEADSRLLESSVQQIAEISTLVYHYTDIGFFNDQSAVAVFGREFRLLGTARSFIVSFAGEIRFGVDASEISIGIDGQVVNIAMPRISVLSHAIDMDSIQLLDERTGLFASLELEDYTSFIADRQHEIETRDATAHLLSQAQQNTEQAIYALLRSALDDDYSINFIWR